MAESPTTRIPARGDFPVSRVRTATQFLQKLRKIAAQYEQLFRPRIDEIRKNFVQRPPTKPPLADESLEAHSRAYFLNALLAALNWRLDVSPETALPNLVPEAPIQSLEKGTICFLDYLGFERDSARPLLVVEAKRPSSILPRLAKLPDDSRSPSYLEVISRGLTGERLLGQWSQWFSTLRDYIRSVYAKANQAPKRVLLTNGDWLILFLDPSDAFLEGGTCDSTCILVFSDRSELEQRYNELFLALEHSSVVGEAPALTPGELPFYIAGEDVDRLMHGLHLRYTEHPRVYEPSPAISVAPVIFLRSRYGAWLRVETPPKDYDLPHDYSQLATHLDQVHNAATTLLGQVNARLGTCFQACPLSKHYEEEESFDPIRGVVECRQDEFLVVTGNQTHYLLLTPSVPECPHHDWVRSHAAGSASRPSPLMRRSTDPRSFFTSQEEHHCAHRDVALAKEGQITDANQERCGLRSGQKGDAFCEIWRFEVHLCCRTCAFESVCTKAQVFQLPCQRPLPSLPPNTKNIWRIKTVKSPSL
jgi:hypothetical protein